MENDLFWRLRQCQLCFNSIYVPRTMRLQNSKLASLRLLLLLGLGIFLIVQVMMGSLYQKLRADQWIIGDVQTTRSPKPELLNDTEMENLQPTCSTLVAEKLAFMELRHLQRVSRWIDDHGIAIITPSYISDFCAQPTFRNLGRFQYGAQVAGLFFSTLENTMRILQKANLEQEQYTVWLGQAPPSTSFDELVENGQRRWWWGPIAAQPQAKAFLKNLNGSLVLVMSTGQELEAHFHSQNSSLTVVTRNGTVAQAVFEKSPISSLKWQNQVPSGEEAEDWQVLPLLESKIEPAEMLTHTTEKQIIAVGLDQRNPWKKADLEQLLRFLDPSITNEVSNITMVYQSTGAKPCLQRPLAALSQDVGMQDVLLTTMQEHFVYTNPRQVVQLAGRRQELKQEGRFVGGHTNMNVDEVILRISFSSLSHQGLVAGTLAVCPMASSECQTVGPANVRSSEWQGQRQESILIPVAKLLYMHRIDLDTCSASNACTMLLDVEFSNSLDWRRLRPMWSDDFGKLSLQVRVFETSMAGSINVFTDVMDSSGDCIHEVRHAGIRIHVRFSGSLNRWSIFRAAVSFGSLIALASVINSAMEVCTIGCLGNYFLGAKSLVYKAQAVQHVGDVPPSADAAYCEKIARDRVRAQLAEALGSLGKLNEQQVDDLLGLVDKVASESDSDRCA